MQKRNVCQPIVMEPIRPFNEIVGDRDAGASRQNQFILLPGKKIVVGLEPLRVGHHVVVSKDQERSTGHSDSRILSAAKTKTGLAGGPEP